MELVQVAPQTAERLDVVIVGHGKSPKGKGWGPKIDACGLVVRMWDWHWQNPDDYGRKYDVGLFEIAPTLVNTFNQYNQHTPTLGYIGSLLWRASLCKNMPRNTEIVNQEPWNQLGKKLGGIGKTGRLQFTRGGVAACWAIDRWAREGDRVILFGFDNIRLGKTLPVTQGFPEEYLDQPSTFTFRGYVPNQRRYGNHDFGIEWPVMQHLAEQRGVDLAFADDIWS
jgi:hypothetical protein